MIDWEHLRITVVDPDTYVVTENERVYSLQAEQRMVILSGVKGDPGKNGTNGKAATIAVGTVTTLPAGSDATVVNSGTSTDAIFDFGIPRGQDGSGGGTATWGYIDGTLSDQTDLKTALDAKQGTLTFDSTPTNGSTNPVTSDGIYDSLATKQNTLTFDSTPTNGSTNPVTSDGIYDALATKQDTLTFDNTPTANSDNPVKSGGVYTALTGKAAVIEDYVTSSSSTLANNYITLSTNYFLTKVKFERYPQWVYGETPTFWKTPYIYLINSKSITPKLYGSGTKHYPLYEYDDGYFYGGSLEIIYNRRTPSKSYCVITLPYKYIASYAGEVLPNYSTWYSNYRTGTYPTNIPDTGVEVLYTAENPRKIVKYYDYAMLTANTDATHYIGLSDTMDAQDYFQWFMAGAEYTMTDGTDEAKDTATYIAAQDMQTASYVTDLVESELTGNYYYKAEADDRFAPVIKDDWMRTLTGDRITKRAGKQVYAFTVSLKFKQIGTGDPSSSNIRPIMKYTTIDIVAGENYDSEDINHYTWNDPIAAGSWNGLTGVVTATHGYIESYAGETLPGVWYSDRDVYAEGTTPTIGAEVAYEFATPVQFNIGECEEIDTQDEVVITLLNNPNLYTMSITLIDYGIVDTKEYIDAKDAEKLSDAPSDNKTYGRKNGTWTEVTGGGGGSAAWGSITGTLSDQTDLNNALSAKANTSDLGDLATQDTVDYTTEVTNKPTLGTMAAVNDASSDGKEYVRKNGTWAESSGITGVAWGDVTGTLASQTDLKNALDSKQGTLTFDSTPTSGSSNPVTSDGIYDALADKADTADLGDLAYEDSVDYSDVTNTPTLGNLATQDTVDYTTEVTNKPTLGALAGMSTIDYTSNYLTNKPTLGSLADQDTVDYATEVTNKPTLGSMAAQNDAASDDVYYLRRNGAWTDADGRYYTETEIDTSLALKAPLASPALTGTPTAPTASVGTDSTQIATTAFVQDHAPITLSVTASAGSTVTKSDARITATMRVINCVFGTPANVTSDLAWTTSAGSITFTGTFKGSTTITFELVECN